MNSSGKRSPGGFDQVGQEVWICNVLHIAVDVLSARQNPLKCDIGCSVSA